MIIGIALIGSGIFAREAHLPAIRVVKDLKLVAAYSRSLKSATELQAGDDVTLYSEDSGSGKSYDDLLARDDIGAVVIALPILTQPEFIKKALKAGKHVLSEKPIAADVKTATELLKWYQNDAGASKLMWGVAENMRFGDDVLYAAEQAKTLGALKQFQVRVHKFTTPDGKYYLTPWRTTPGYQGGFLLDGGVHYVASLRLLLGNNPDNQITSASAYTTQLQPHLPPIDTVNATLKTRSGISGTFSVSFGTMFDENTYQFAFEKGSIVVEDESCKIRHGRRVEPQVKSFPDMDDVKAEITCWAEGIKAGRLDARLSAEEALKDLVLLEAMFDSGEQNGTAVSIA